MKLRELGHGGLVVSASDLELGFQAVQNPLVWGCVLEQQGATA